MSLAGELRARRRALDVVDGDRQQAARRAARTRIEHGRTRWGALRIFNQHFKYLTGHWDLAEALLKRVQDDSVAVNRMQAAQRALAMVVLGRDGGAPVKIEDVFIGQLAVREHPWVRRNLIEALHNVLDDNVRYLNNDWIPALKSEATRQRVKSGQRASALRQASKIALALTGGNELQRDGLLRSFYAFHLRESAAEMTPEVAHFAFPDTDLREGKVERGENTWLEGYKWAASFDPRTAGSGILGRIGNDTEPPTFYEDSGPVLARALARLLESNNPAVALAVLRTFRSTKGVPLDGSSSARLLQIARQASGASGHELEELLREILPGKFVSSGESLAALADVIKSETGFPFTLAAAIVGERHNADLSKSPEIVGAVRARPASARWSPAARSCSNCC